MPAIAARQGYRKPLTFWHLRKKRGGRVSDCFGRELSIPPPGRLARAVSPRASRQGRSSASGGAPCPLRSCVRGTRRIGPAGSRSRPFRPDAAAGYDRPRSRPALAHRQRSRRTAIHHARTLDCGSASSGRLALSLACVGIRRSHFCDDAKRPVFACHVNAANGPAGRGLSAVVPCCGP